MKESTELDRVAIALEAKKNSVNDFFGGWSENDLLLLNRYKFTGSVQARPGEIIDWLGVRTEAKLHSWLPLKAGDSLTIKSIPVPDDQVHAEAIEYIALLLSLERSLDYGSSSFTAFEIGASYAPWAVAAGVLALRSRGFEAINLVALEANNDMANKIIDHAKMNDLLNYEKLKILAIHGAIHVRDEYVYFPKVNVKNDNGAQITLDPIRKDYRGVEVDLEKINGISFDTLSENYDRIDFLHMDVQGAEASLLNDDSFLNLLDSKVATFFLATQSRLIEGIALQRLSGLGWLLINERPTIYKQNNRTDDINGWTLRDGGQIWLNPKLGKLFCNN